MKILRLPSNTMGRDLIVGDLHGHIEDFRRLLEEASFNPEIDRVFCTGDLVDRGPDSLACLALLHEKWFGAAMGNHELLFVENIRALMDAGLDGVSASPNILTSYMNGNNVGAGWLVGAYLNQPDHAYWEDAISLVQSMPNLIVVGSGEHRFHVVHGGLMVAQSILDDHAIDVIEHALARGRFNAAERASIAYDLAWNRSIAHFIQENVPCESIHPGLSTTFCGHNIVDRPAMALSHYHMDTGSGLQHRYGRTHYGLTMAITENGFPVTTLTTKEHEKHDSCHC